MFFFNFSTNQRNDYDDVYEANVVVDFDSGKPQIDNHSSGNNRFVEVPISSTC